MGNHCTTRFSWDAVRRWASRKVQAMLGLGLAVPVALAIVWLALAQLH